MPNRIIKESAFSSDKIAQLSDFEFRLWIGLITQADDVGRGDARPAIIKGRVFPLRERVTISDIDKALQHLAALGCVSLYVVGGKPYFSFPNWAAHQRIRNVVSKYPAPEDADISPRVTASCGELPPESESESESESNQNVCAEQTAFHSTPLPLNDSTEYKIPLQKVDEWRKLYPGVDVDQELRNMRGWCLANPTKRKTRAGIDRFITNWLSGEQNKGKTYNQNAGYNPSKKRPSDEIEAAYDIDRAEEKMNTRVPQFKKRPK